MALGSGAQKGCHSFWLACSHVVAFVASSNRHACKSVVDICAVLAVCECHCCSSSTPSTITSSSEIDDVFSEWACRENWSVCIVVACGGFRSSGSSLLFLFKRLLSGVVGFCRPFAWSVACVHGFGCSGGGSFVGSNWRDPFGSGKWCAGARVWLSWRRLPEVDGDGEGMVTVVVVELVC